MNTITILIGISGSGKSTYAKKMLRENSNLIRINRDDLRTCLRGTLVGYYTKPIKKYEDIVTSLEDKILRDAKFQKMDIVVDNTNLSMKYINKYLYLEMYQYKIKVVLFDVPTGEAKNRVYHRDFLGGDPYGEFDFIDGSEAEEVAYIEKQSKQLQTIKKELQALNNIDLEIIKN